MWLSVDPLVYDNTFWKGEHNGGFYNSFNQGSYMYCYQNPIALIDPNGKQTEATESGSVIQLQEVVCVAGKKSGFSWSSFGKGLIKGLVIAAVVAVVIVAVVATGGAALVAAGAVSAGTIATVGTVATYAGGALAVGAITKASVEAYTKEDLFTGEKLTVEQASENLGNAIGSSLGGYGGAKYAAGKLNFKVDLMGGPNGEKGFINYDLNASKGIKGDVDMFSSVFPKNSISVMQVNNPRAPFLDKITSTLKPGATLTVRGQISNGDFKSVFKQLQNSDVFKVNSIKTNLSNEGYFQTGGTKPLGGSNNIIEINVTKQ